MSVGIQVDNIITELGTADFVHAFFSTISAVLEPDGWGSRFPCLLTHLYSGKLEKHYADTALAELAIIRDELKAYPPSRVVWDIEDRSLSPPWGDDIAPHITDLSTYFVTSTGHDLLDTLEEVILFLRDEGTDCTLMTI